MHDVQMDARHLLVLDYSELWALDGDSNYPITLRFDDGQIDTTIRETIFSAYCWWPHKKWNKTPLLVQHHIGAERLTGGTLLRIMERAFRSAMDVYGDGIDPEEIAWCVKHEVNRVYNDFNDMLEPYVTSISALDFLDVLTHPDVEAANNEVQSLDLSNRGIRANSPKYIQQAQAKIRSVLMNDPGLNGNRLAETNRMKAVDIKQTLQVVGPRGNLTEIDSNLFPYPILRGFGHGLRQLHDIGIESRSAAKALMLQKDPLADVEYFNRQMQLVCGTLRNLHRNDDCGNVDCIPWHIQRNNLNAVDGMYYMDSDGQYKIITERCHHLIDKTVMLRTVLTCKHEDQYGVCGKCFGELRHSIPKLTNLAHVSSTELCAKVSQNVLSTKHLDGSAVVDEFTLSPYDAQYIRVMNDENQLGLSSELQGLNVRMVVSRYGATNLGDIALVKDIKDLALDRVSAMNEVTFEVIEDDGDIMYATIPVAMGSRRASFTREFLKFLKADGYTLTEDRDIRIDLSNWNRDLPIWELPRKQADMMEFMGSVERMVKASGRNRMKQNTDLSNYDNLSQALTDFYDLVSQKFAINLTHLAVILRATMVRNKKALDFRLPANGTGREFAGFGDIMRLRSLSAMAAFQYQAKMFRDPLSYILKDRPTHPFDAILVDKNK